MGYQIIVKQYKGSVPVKKESWELGQSGAEQKRNAENIPCMLQCIRERKESEEHFILRLEMLERMEEPIALSLEYVEENCSGKEYVFLPAAVYDGNRMTIGRFLIPLFMRAEQRQDGHRSLQIFLILIRTVEIPGFSSAPGI